MKTLLEYLVSNKLPVDYVDLDLPSGLKWAKMNIGAERGSNPADWYGLYFAWGDTKGYSLDENHDFDWDTYKFGENNNITKYNEEDKIKILEDEDDAAYVNTKQFRMPTSNDFFELLKNTNHTWVENYNDIAKLNGLIFTSKKDEKHFIFMPASGERYSNNKTTEKYFILWCSTLAEKSNGDAVCFHVNKHDSYYLSEVPRYYGNAIRGVINK